MCVCVYILKKQITGKENGLIFERLSVLIKEKTSRSIPLSGHLLSHNDSNWS